MFLRLFAVILLLSLPAGIFAYGASQKAVVAELTEAARKNNVGAVAARVDWDALRAYLKTDIDDQKRFLGPRGEMVGPNTADIPRVVDYYVQPQNIDILFYQRHHFFPGAREEDFIEKVAFAPPFGFKMTLGYPKNFVSNDPVLTLLRDKVKVHLVFRLDSGLNWKIKELQVPVYLVPRQTYDKPPLQIFGRPGSY